MNEQDSNQRKYHSAVLGAVVAAELVASVAGAQDSFWTKVT